MTKYRSFSTISLTTLTSIATTESTMSIPKVLQPFQPLIQPEIPFVAKLEAGLEPELLITIDGFVPSYAEGFQVNLASGPNFDEGNRSLTALHFKTSFKKKEIVRNTYIPLTGWGNEERTGAMTIEKNRPFQMTLLTESYDYKIGINGHHFCDYLHRLPYQDVNTLQIVGDIAIEKVLLHTAPPHFNFPPIPFDYPIRSWMGLGREITIIGRPKLKPQRFHVQLYNKSTGDILLHFNPYFGDKPYIARNAYIDGTWGEEQTETPFCNFQPDALFTMKILCEADFYTISTNGKHFCYFVHRLPYNQATNIRIVGDVDIESINFA